jgi:hypothetical protein
MLYAIDCYVTENTYGNSLNRRFVAPRRNTSNVSDLLSRGLDSVDYYVGLAETRVYYFECFVTQIVWGVEYTYSK